MANTAILPLVADRYQPCVRRIYLVGIDMTGVDMRAQVRLSGDTPGLPLVDLLTVTNGNAEGLRLVGVATDPVTGVKTSTIELVLNETTMEGLPYMGEVGDAAEMAWDWQATLSGRKRRLAKGAFVILGDGVTGANGAPANRLAGSGVARVGSASTWQSAQLTFGEESVTVQVDGADLLAPLVDAASTAKGLAEAARDAAATAANVAALSESAAAGFVGGIMYPTTAAGLAAVAEGAYFTVAGDGANTYAILYRKQSGAAQEQARFASRAAFQGTGGAALVGYQSAAAGSAARTLAAFLADQPLNPKDFGAVGDGNLYTLAALGYSLAQAQARWGTDIVKSVGQSIESVAINAALAAAAGGSRKVVLPDGRYCLGETLRIPSFVTFHGQSRDGTVLYNQNYPLNAPMMQNADSTAFLFANIGNMTVLGGTMALKVSATIETAGCTIENITANLQTQKSMEWSSCQTTVIRNCELRGARDYGIDFLGFPCNAVTLDHVRIGDARRYPLRLRGYDLFTICNSSSIEAGALQPNNVTCSAAGTTLSVSALNGPNIELDQLIVGDGIVPGTRVIANAATNPTTYTGGGGGGTYGISTAQNFTSRSATISYAAIDAEAGLSGTANMLVIRDTYFEAIPKIILHNLTASGSPSGTMFDGNKVTATVDGAGPLFSGNATITFGTNFWGQPTPGPMSATIIGQNKGMTLDRLWVPTVSAYAGALAGYTVNECTYRDLPGGLRRITIDVTITNNGSATNAIYVTLPSLPAANDILPGREIAIVGFGLAGQIVAGSNILLVTKAADGGYPGANGYRLLISGTYRTQ